MKEFENIINTAWDNKESINGKSDQSILDAIKETIELVDKGILRVAEIEPAGMLMVPELRVKSALEAVLASDRV